MGSASSKFKKYIQHGDEFAAMQIYQSSPELRKSLDPNLSYGENHHHNTALHYAAKHGMKHLLRTFLNDHGGNPNKKNGKNESVLHAACQVGARKTFSSQERRAACVALLLQWRGCQLSTGEREKVQVDAQDSNGNSALHAAACSGLQRCVELLLAAGAPLFLENNDKMTPCDTAVKAENHAIARLLESKMVFADDSSSDTVNEVELYGCNESSDEVYSGLRTQDLQEAKDQLLVETSDMLNIPLFTAEALLRDNEWSRECLLEKWIRDAVKCCQVAGVKPPPSAYQTNALTPVYQTATATADDRETVSTSCGGLYPDDRFQDKAEEVIEEDDELQPKDEQMRGSHEEEEMGDFIVCEICYSEIAKEDWPSISMTCDHQFCSNCWESYLTGKIQEGGEHRILCPAHHCHILVPSELIERLVPPNIARRYLQFDIKAFVETNRSIKWCPMAGCGRAVRLPETEHNRATEMRTSHAVDCGNGHFFCWECLGEAHAPCACSEWQKWLGKISEVRPEELSASSRSEHEDAANCLWLVTNSKPCPNCQSPIQKSEGCNHMKCSKCKYDFCWVCLESWKRHNSTTGGYFRCNRFEAVHKADEKQGVLISEAMVRNQQTTELNRFLHYYTRFRNHENSRRLEEPLLTGIGLKMEALASTRSKKGDTECTKFVEEGVRELLKARRILCGSYVHGYYLEDNGYSRTIFEFMQALQNELEEATEKLSEMVARPYLRTPKGVIVQTTALARRKRHEFARAVSKGLVPPETPPARKRNATANANYRVLAAAIDANHQTVTDAITATLKDLDGEEDGWVKDSQGKHNNLSAALYGIQDVDSEEESEVNRALAVSVLGECAKVGCSRPRAHDARTSTLHDYCSARCSKMAAGLDSYQVNVTSDYNMDLVIALEMSRLQMIEDEMKQKQKVEGDGTGLNSKSTNNPNEPSSRRDELLALASHIPFQDQTISSISERPQMPLPQDIDLVDDNGAMLQSISGESINDHLSIDKQHKSFKFGTSSSLGSYQKSSADLAVDYFLKSLARNMDMDNEEGASNLDPSSSQRSASTWEKKRSIDKDNMWKPCCAVAEDGRFEISEIHETGLYNDPNEFDGDGDSRSLKRSHSTGDLVMKRGRLATRADEPRYHLDSDHSSQHDDRPEDLSRRILAVSGTNRHSLTLQSSAGSGSTTCYGGQSSLEDTTTSDSLNADLEVCGILGSSTGDEDINCKSSMSSMQNVIHLATLPRNLATIGKKNALDLGDADNRQSLSDDLLTNVSSESSEQIAGNDSESSSSSAMHLKPNPVMSTSKSLTNVCLRSRFGEERSKQIADQNNHIQTKSSLNFQRIKKDLLSVKRKESPSPPSPTLHTAFYQPSCSKFTFDEPPEPPSSPPQFQDTIIISAASLINSASNSHSSAAEPYSSEAPLSTTAFNYNSPVTEISPKTSLLSRTANFHLSENEFDFHHADTCKVKSVQMSDFCQSTSFKSGEAFPLLAAKNDIHLHNSNRISPIHMQHVGSKYAFSTDLATPSLANSEPFTASEKFHSAKKTLSSYHSKTKSHHLGESPDHDIKSFVNEKNYDYSRYETVAPPSYVINPLTLSPPNCKSTDSKKNRLSHGHQFNETQSSNGNESDITDVESLNIISPAGSWNNIDDSIPKEYRKDIEMNKSGPDHTEDASNSKFEKSSSRFNHNVSRDQLKKSSSSRENVCNIDKGSDRNEFYERNSSRFSQNISRDQLKKCSSSRENVCNNDKGNDKSEVHERPGKSRNLLRASSSSSLLVSNIGGVSSKRNDRKSDGCLKISAPTSTIFDKSCDGTRTMFTSKDPSFRLKLLDTNNPRKVPRSFFKRSSMPSEYMSAAIASSLNVTDNRQSKSALTLNEAASSRPMHKPKSKVGHGLRITITGGNKYSDDDDDHEHHFKGKCKKVMCLETDSSNEYESETGIPKSPTLFISGVSISRTPEPKSPASCAFGRTSRSSSLTAPPLRANPFVASRNNSQSLTAALGLSFRRRINPAHPPTPQDRTLITSSTPSGIYSSSFYSQGVFDDRKLLNISSYKTIDKNEMNGVGSKDLCEINNTISISSTPPSPRDLPANFLAPVDTCTQGIKTTPSPIISTCSLPLSNNVPVVATSGGGGGGGLVKSSTDGALSSVLHVREGSLGSDDFHEALFLLERSPKVGSGRRKRTKQRAANTANTEQMEASSAL
ncbi:uncharacterized protein LOC111051560 isoform X2 [Nilaparvata lugens]|uniref:uncharacterized protein LOC111051560 isoform X2 n=1 Tax=Nilaparvata lugens TaxID=108931 RepID=UPI00193DB7D2|nr:uncharacterized protein LOC111051560 isoform X2 [Nilaparvata lugens]